MVIENDGSIHQVEITSCGLNGQPLAASGVYPAAIACHWSDPTVVSKIDYTDPVMKTQVRVTERKNQSYITGIKDQTIVGYKHFSFSETNKIALEVKGDFSGRIAFSHDEQGKQNRRKRDSSSFRCMDALAYRNCSERRGKCIVCSLCGEKAYSL